MRRALLFVAISHCVATQAGANPLTSADVPAGFEALVEGQVEQVEVTLLGQSLGLHPVLVRPDTVRFEHPDRLARALIDAGATADAAALTALLRDPLAGNGHLSCQGNAPGNGACDYVPTESLAVIHDQSESRISVFLRKDWLPVSGAKASEWHTPSEAENALIHRQIINVSGSDDYRAINVDGVGALGIADNGHVGFGWHYSDYSQRGVRDSTFELDNIHYRHDLGRTHYVQAGRMDMRALSGSQGGNFALSLMPIEQVDGMRAGTTMAFLNRSVAGQGTPVTVVLNQRARVDAFRGEQILGTAYFDAGLHAMDTGNFPEGSYPVTLKVIENGEVVRTEVVPFTRTGGGASGDDRLQWFIQTGRTTPNGHHRDERPEAVVNAGVRLPVGRDVNLTSALTLRDGETYNESRVDWRGAAGSSAWGMSAAVLAGTDGTRGDLQQIDFSNRLSAGVYRYAVRAPDCRTSQTGQISGCYTSLTATAGLPVFRGTLSAAYTYSDRKHALVRSNATPTSPLADDWNLHSSDGVQLNFATSFNARGHLAALRVGAYQRDAGGPVKDRGVFANVSLALSKRADTTHRSHRNTSLAVDYRNDKFAGGSHDLTQVSVDHSRTWQGESQRQLDLGATMGTDDRWDVGVGGSVDGHWGRATGNVTQSGNRNTSSTGYSGSYSSSMAVGKSGAFFGGSANSSDPGAAIAFVVDDGDAEHEGQLAASISSGSGPRRQLEFGQKHLLPVDAFNATYTQASDGTASRASLGAVTKGGGRRDWFLQPGKLAVHHIGSALTYTYVGRLVDDAGSPLSNATILNAEYGQTNDDGRFAADFKRRPEKLHLFARDRLHVCDIESLMKESVVRVGTTTCLPSGIADLPEELREHRQVRRMAANLSAGVGETKATGDSL